jgi:ActR/RegA family two-component response regulator
MKSRLLLVDDEEQFVEALSERLSMRDYDVTTSLTGEDAIEKIKTTILMWLSLTCVYRELMEAKFCAKLRA